jgi:nucleoside-diphosphate-sugar epimerase
MAEAARLAGTKRIFFSSSACVYPGYKQEKAEISPLKESDAYPADPEDGYGWEKLFSEHVYQKYRENYGLDIRIARYHNIYGPEGTYEGGREKAPAALCRKIAFAEDGGEIEIWGDGEQTRSFCYIDDCVEGTWRLMESDFDEPLNIGSDRLVTINEMADIIARIARKNLKKKYLLDKPQGVRGRNSDNTLLKQVLGWEPRVSLEEGLAKTYKWIEEQVRKVRTV